MHQYFTFSFFIIFFFNLLCENRQQPTWILCSLSCTVVQLFVCAPFFFFFLLNTFKLLLKSNLKSKHFIPLFVLVWFVLWWCENRQQPTWIFRSSKCTFVHTCVCARFFFFFCSTSLITISSHKTQFWGSLCQQTSFCVLFFVF